MCGQQSESLPGTAKQRRKGCKSLGWLQAHLVLDEILGSGFVMDVSQATVTAPLAKLPVQATRSSNVKP